MFYNTFVGQIINLSIQRFLLSSWTKCHRGDLVEFRFQEFAFSSFHPFLAFNPELEGQPNQSSIAYTLQTILKPNDLNALKKAAAMENQNIKRNCHRLGRKLFGEQSKT